MVGRYWLSSKAFYLLPENKICADFEKNVYLKDKHTRLTDELTEPEINKNSEFQI